MENDKGQGALAGLRVLEYGEAVAGAYCTKLLADMGAEVVKIEKPRVGDRTRHMEPFLGGAPDAVSLPFLYLNTNKLGVTLEVADPWGLDAFKSLAAHADILVESTEPGTMERQGISYDVLKEVNAGLIVVSITPFGQDGPYLTFKGSDLIIFALSGLACFSPAGGVTDPDNEYPLRAPGLQSHFASGATAAVAAMSGIIQRVADGEGQHIDVSEQQAVCAAGSATLSPFLYNREPRTRGRFGALGTVMILATNDGYICIETLTEEEWEGLVEVMGSPDWAQGELFKERAVRAANWDAIEPMVTEWTSQHGKWELSMMLQQRGVKALPVNTAEDLANSEQLQFRRFFVDLECPGAGSVKFPGAPYRLSLTPWQLLRAAPQLGEHNEEILAGRLGYAKEELLKLRGLGVI